MSFSIVWEASAVAMLRHFPTWQAAARVCRSVMVFAETGRGDVRRLGHSNDYRLYVPPYVVRFTMNIEERVLLVWGCFRAGG